MKLDIARLREGDATVLAEDWDPKTQDLEIPGWSYQGKVNVEATALKDSGIVRVGVVLKSSLSLTCSRCFKEFVKPLASAFELIYPCDLTQRIIELADDIREELMLTYPQKLLCREDCKGLCARCGADLNEEECHCQEGIKNA